MGGARDERRTGRHIAMGDGASGHDGVFADFDAAGNDRKTADERASANQNFAGSKLIDAIFVHEDFSAHAEKHVVFDRQQFGKRRIDPNSGGKEHPAADFRPQRAERRHFNRLNGNRNTTLSRIALK